METKFLNLSPEYLLNSTYTVFTYGRYTITFPKGIPDFDMFDNPNITKEIKRTDILIENYKSKIEKLIDMLIKNKSNIDWIKHE